MDYDIVKEAEMIVEEQRANEPVLLNLIAIIPRCAIREIEQILIKNNVKINARR